MKTLIRILNRLRPLNPNFYFIIENPPHPAITIEQIGTGPRRKPAVSVTSITSKNNTLLRTPEIRFELDICNQKIVEVLPYYYKDDEQGIEQHSVTECPNDRDSVRIDFGNLIAVVKCANLLENTLAKQRTAKAQCLAYRTSSVA